MKHCSALFLSLLLLIPFSSCARNNKEQTSKTEENLSVEKKVTKEDDFKYPDICDTLTLEALEDIPIAKSSMTESVLRQICLDYFYLQLTFAWTPSKDINYTIVSSGSKVKLSRGKIYGGLPYVTDAEGNLYRVFDFYDSKTGIITPPVTDQDFAEIFGNQCSYGSFWAWSRVCNSVKYNITHTITAANGVIPVGPYTYDTENIKSFKTKSTKDICDDNGKQTIFESYAALKPADGLVYYNTAGHVIMCASEPSVVYKKDGTIDGEKSTLKVLEQNTGWSAATQSDGSDYVVQGGVYAKKTFDKLFSKGYLPFTFAEFQGKDPVEDGQASLDLVEGKNTMKDIKNATLKANYPISHLHIKVLDEKGEEVYRYIERVKKINTNEVEMDHCIFPTSLKKFSDGKHTLEITCFLGNGEKLTVFTSTVTK